MNTIRTIAFLCLPALCAACVATKADLEEWRASIEASGASDQDLAAAIDGVIANIEDREMTAGDWAEAGLGIAGALLGTGALTHVSVNRSRDKKRKQRGEPVAAKKT